MGVSLVQTYERMSLMVVSSLSNNARIASKSEDILALTPVTEPHCLPVSYEKRDPQDMACRTSPEHASSVSAVSSGTVGLIKNNSFSRNKQLAGMMKGYTWSQAQ